MKFFGLSRRSASAFTATVSLVLLASVLAGCCCGRPRRTESGKNAVAQRRVSEFDFYCSLRPADRRTAGKETIAFTTVVFEAMKARGYKVYLVRYDAGLPPARVRPAGYGFRDFFGSSSQPGESLQAQPFAYSGYGMRDFFGDRTAAASSSQAGPVPGSAADDGSRAGARAGNGRGTRHRQTSGGAAATTERRGDRQVVVWETRRGEHFLVTGPYAEPVWVAGQSWLERVRFCDPSAQAIAGVES